MSDFDKKKPNIKNDTDTDEIYEIPDIVTGGSEHKEAKEPKIKKEKRVKPMKQTNSENNKEKHNKENKKHTFEMKNKKHSKKAAQDDEAVQAAVKAVLKHLVTLVVFWCASLVRSLWCA